MLLAVLKSWLAADSCKRFISENCFSQAKTPSKPSGGNKRNPARGKSRPVISDEEEEDDDDVSIQVIAFKV